MTIQDKESLGMDGAFQRGTSATKEDNWRYIAKAYLATIFFLQ